MPQMFQLASVAIILLSLAYATHGFAFTKVATSNAASGLHSGHDQLQSTTSLAASKSTLKQLKREAWAEGRGMSGGDDSSPALPPCTIVGGGRIGDLLSGSSPGGKVVGRSDDMTDLPAGPIYVCTRNDALDDVVERCPEDRREDLVFLQNGYIEDWLKEKGLGDNTQILLFLAVTAKGADPIDGGKG